MAGTVCSGSLVPQFNAQQTQSGNFFSAQPVLLNQTPAPGISLKNGTLLDQMDLIGTQTFTFTGTTPQTLVVNSFLDPFGAASVFVRFCMWLFVMHSQTDGVTLVIGNAGSNPYTGFLSATGTLTLQASSPANPGGGFFCIGAPNTTGMAVGTGVNLLMTPSASLVADVLAYGRHS